MMTSSIKIFALLVVCIFASLASAKNWQLKSRIVGGSSAVEKQFPYQVSIRGDRDNSHFCGGVIIQEHYILTAGHCFSGCQGSSLFYHAVVNVTHANDIGIKLKFSQLTYHQDFRTYKPYPDLLLIRTVEPIVFSEFVQPVNLPTQDTIESGIKTVLSGWGIFKVSLHFSQTKQ